MKTPSLEEVKAYFKDVKEVRCLASTRIKTLSGKKTKINSEAIFREQKELWLNCGDSMNALVWKYGEYAEIISYKEKTYESAKANQSVKQYKHIPTGKIAEKIKEATDCYFIEDIYLPDWLIENSSDWEEVITDPVLFLTEDGVEIRKGDKFYVVDEQYGKFKMHDTIGGHFTKEHKHRKRFSNKEKASEYVLRNKPCLSVNDVFYGTKKAFVNNEAMSALVELAKSKISDQQ
jgi:hypothetical protein